MMSMMNKCKFCIAALVLLVLCVSCTKKIACHTGWNQKVYKKANTARLAFYMSRRAKESIRVINLCRSNPTLFAETYLKDYLQDNESLKTSHYVQTLLNTLMQTRPMPLLRPGFTLRNSAGYHAFTSGITGYTGHDLWVTFTTRLRIFGTFSSNIGENCDYGNVDAMDVIMDLLIDEGVASVGHRKNLLNARFLRVGCAFRHHKRYKVNYVQDFSKGNWKDWIWKKD